MIQIRALGGISVVDGAGRPLESVLQQPKPLALLAYLAIAAPRGFVRRDTLLALFWPEGDEKRARGSLKQTVYSLRQALGTDAIVSRGDDEIGLDPRRVTCDAWAFDEHVAAGEYARAAELYRGRLLDGFHLKGAAEFSQWLDGVRERVASDYGDVLEKLVDAAIGAGDISTAALWVRWLGEHRPYHTQATVRVMEILSAQGDRAGALKCAVRYAERMRADLDAEPAPEVMEYAQRLRAEPERVTGTGAVPEATVGSMATTFGGVMSRTRRRSRAVYAGAVLGGMAALGLGIFATGGARTALVANRVAVAPFANLSADTTLDPLAEAAAYAIARGLSGITEVEIYAPMESGRTYAALVDVDDGRSMTRRFADATDARTIVTGTYSYRRDSLEVAAQIVDATRARVRHTIPAVRVSRTEDPMAAVDSLLVRIRGAFAFEETSARNSIQLQPPRYEAVLEFHQGARSFHRGAMRSAAARMAAAVALDPSFGMARVVQAVSWQNLRQYQIADSLVTEALRLPHTLTRQEHAMLEMVSADASGNPGRRLAAAREAAEYSGGQGMAHYTYAWWAIASNYAREGVDVLEEIDPESPSIRSWHYYWAMLGMGHHMLGDHRRELAAIREGLERFPDNRVLRQYEVLALGALGRTTELSERLDDYAALSTGSGGLSLSAVTRQAGASLYTHGHEDAGRALVERTLARARSRYRADSTSMQLLFRQATTLFFLDSLASAAAIVDRLLEEDPERMSYRGWAGAIAAARGDRETAERMSDWLQALERPYLRGHNTLWRAYIAAQLGDLEQAMALLRDAYATGEMHSHFRRHEIQLAPLWDYEPYRKLVAPK